MKNLVLFLSPHQDDELLTFGIPIIRALEQKNTEVYIALITDGGASAVKNKLGLEREAFVSARDQEFRASCAALGLKPENIIIPANREPDGGLRTDKAKERIREILKSLTGFDTVTLATICPFGTEKQHKDHKALGNAVLDMHNGKKDGVDKIKLYLEPYEYARLGNGIEYNILKTDKCEKIDAALDSYKNSEYGIAFLSVPRELYFYKRTTEAYEYIGRDMSKLKRYSRRAGLLAAKLSAYLSCRKIRCSPAKLTCTDYIYNRPDLYTEHYETYQITYKGRKYVAEIDLDKKPAELCIRLSEFPRDAARMLCKYIFKQHPDLETITMQQVFFETGKAVPTNHFRIEFPETVEELTASLTHSRRKTIKRTRKILEEQYPDVEYIQYEGRENITDEVVEAYFKYKLISHNRDYHMTPQQYLEYYHVTNSYVIKSAGRIIAVYFDCEQCDIVNSENFSFDRDLPQLSLGLLLRDYSFQEMVKKGKKQVFLGGGSYNQKFLYNYTEDMTYTCTISRNDIPRISQIIRHFAGKILPPQKKQPQKAQLPYELFYSLIDPAMAPELNGLALRKAADEQELTSLCKSYRSTLNKMRAFTEDVFPNEKEKLKKRLTDGSVFYALCSSDECVSSGWLAYKHDFYISEISTAVSLKDSDAAILYDFYTEPSQRGHGYYPVLLQQIMNDAKYADAFIIYTNKNNTASQHGIRKAGFKHDGDFTEKNIRKYLKRFHMRKSN